jgi:hypothetical protein
MLDEKSKDKEVSITTPTVRHGQLIDLMTALKQSMERAAARPTRKKPRRVRRNGRAHCSYEITLAARIPMFVDFGSFDGRSGRLLDCSIIELPHLL